MTVSGNATPIEIRAPRAARLLEIDWSDGRTMLYEHVVLRAFCPCAHCQGHQGPVQWVHAVETAEGERGLDLSEIAEVGQYALSLRWADGHSTGIYTFAYLRSLGDAFELPRERQRLLTFER